MQSDTIRQPILILGGVGFVGYHLVHFFLQEESFGPVAVISRNATKSKNKIADAMYYDGDLADSDRMRRLLSEIRPSIIIHAATPSPITGTTKEYERVTVEGTRTMLGLAKTSKWVQAFIFTSSSTMALGREHVNLDEDSPLADTNPKSHPYARTKATADRMVLAANTLPNPLASTNELFPWEGHLRTASLRLPIVYGTHDQASIPGALSALENGQTNFQLGDGKNVWDFCSTENAARAHILVAQALLHPGMSGKVDGEAFHIHDGEPRHFWDFARCIWELAGHDSESGSVWVLPTWLAVGIAVVAEVAVWIFTLGTKRPQGLGVQQVEYACFTHTYSIDKAKERLGYRPLQRFEEEMEKAVRWQMDNGGWKGRLQEFKR